MKKLRNSLLVLMFALIAIIATGVVSEAGDFTLSERAAKKLNQVMQNIGNHIFEKATEFVKFNIDQKGEKVFKEAAREVKTLKPEEEVVSVQGSDIGDFEVTVKAKDGATYVYIVNVRDKDKVFEKIGYEWASLLKPENMKDYTESDIKTLEKMFEATGTLESSKKILELEQKRKTLELEQRTNTSEQKIEAVKITPAMRKCLEHVNLNTVEEAEQAILNDCSPESLGDAKDIVECEFVRILASIILLDKDNPNDKKVKKFKKEVLLSVDHMLSLLEKYHNAEFAFDRTAMIERLKSFVTTMMLNDISRKTLLKINNAIEKYIKEKRPCSSLTKWLSMNGEVRELNFGNNNIVVVGVGANIKSFPLPVEISQQLTRIAGDRGNQVKYDVSLNFVNWLFSYSKKTEGDAHNLYCTLREFVVDGEFDTIEFLINNYFNYKEIEIWEKSTAITLPKLVFKYEF